jgi:hypothetical protein
MARLADPNPQTDPNTGKPYYVVETEHGTAPFYPDIPEHGPVLRSLGVAAPSEDQKSLKEWADFGSSIASGAKAVGSAVADAAKQVPTPAENMRTMFASDPQSTPVQPPIVPQSAPVRAEPKTVQPMEGGEAVPVPSPAAESPQSAQGPQTVDITETQRKLYGDKEMKASHEAQVSEIGAYKAHMDAEAALSTAKQTQADRLTLENAKFIDTELQQRHEEDKAKAERLSQYQAKKDEYNGLTVDSRRMWNDASTGDKLLATVAMALGGMGMALQGRAGNPAWDIIDKTIDRDIDQQKANINQRGRELDAERTAYQDFLQATGDERAARLATKEMALQKIAGEYESAIGRATNDAQKMSLAQGLAGVQEKQARYNMELSEVLQTTKPQVIVSKPKEVQNATSMEKMVNSETQLDQIDALIKDIKADPNKAGLLSDIKAKALQSLGSNADPKSEAFRARVSEIANARLNELYGGVLSPQEAIRGAKAIADYSDNPELLVTKLEVLLDGSAKRAYNQRMSQQEVLTVPTTRSPYMQTYTEKQQSKKKK